MTTGPSSLSIDPATPADVPLILSLIHELAEYERLAHQVRARPEQLQRHLFGPRPYAEAVVARTGADPVGFALWFHNYSTFEARPGLYLEDLFVRPAQRGRGYGEALLRYLARLAVERDCARVEWAVLDWNEPAIRFYRRLGAAPMNDWTVQRVSGEALRALAALPGTPDESRR